MKFKYQSLLLFLLSFFIFSCGEEEEEDFLGNWSELSDFDGVPRSDAVGFTINNKGYIGTGYDGDDRLNDFWEYNPELNYWTQKADFPGEARTGAVGIGINNKGYIGTGYNGDDKLNDFWEFDATENIWERKADFSGSGRYGAVGFAINDKIFIGSGYDGNYLKDFYEYTPATDMWTKIISIGGSKRKDASCFVIGTKAYVTSGLDNGSYLDDLWEYDPENSSLWTKKRNISDTDDDEDYDDDYTTIPRINAVGFAVNGMGYLATGSTSSLSSTVWEYDQVYDLWEEKTSFEGTSRTEAVGFSIGSKVYITTGRSSSYYLDDIWSFNPTEEYDEDN